MAKVNGKWNPDQITWLKQMDKKGTPMSAEEKKDWLQMQREGIVKPTRRTRKPTTKK